MAKKNWKSKVWTILFIVFNIAVLYWLISQDQYQTADLHNFTRFNFPLILVAVALVLLYITFDADTYRYLTKLFTGKASMRTSLEVSLLGRYYDAVTPFGSGGQPFQIYHLTKSGVSTGHSSCVILIKYFIYQICFSAAGIAAIIFNSGKAIALGGPLYYAVSILGIIINLATPLVIFLMTHRRERFIKIYKFFIRLGVKMRLIKDREKAENYIDKVVSPFIEALTLMREHKSKVVYVFFITVIEILAFISIPYAVYLSTMVTQTVVPATWIEFVSLFLFVYFVTSIVPIPGGSGGAELGFGLVFSSFFTTDATLPLSILLWRGISFYLPLFSGFVVSITTSIKRSANKSKLVAAETETEKAE